MVLAGSLHEEEDGLGCSAEGRVIHWQKSIDPPGEARRDSDIIIDLAHRLGRGQYFPFKNPADILEELRIASRGGVADYYGITYERVDKQMGIFWPCPSLDHPGTPRLFVDRKFYTHDGKAHFNVTEWRPSGDPISDEYPSISNHGPGREPVFDRDADPAHRCACRPVSGAAGGDSSPPGGAARHQGRRLGDSHDPPRRSDDPRYGGQDYSTRYGLHSLSLGREPAAPTASPTGLSTHAARFPNSSFLRAGLPEPLAQTRRPTIEGRI